MNVTIVVLKNPTAARGLEWGEALAYAKAIDTKLADRFLVENGICMCGLPSCHKLDLDTYAFVVPNELWSDALNQYPHFEIEVPAHQVAALTEEIERQRDAEDSYQAYEAQSECERE